MRENNWNIPNILTMIRFFLIPVVVVLIVQQRMIWALAVFLIACFTDLVDGYIARSRNLVTRLGIWLDPLADKCMAVAVLITFTFCRIIPPLVTIVVFTKEFLLLLGGLIILRKGFSTPSNKFGKTAAFVLNVAIATGFMYQYWAPYYLYFIYFALIVVVVAFIQYAWKNGGLLFQKKQASIGKERE